MVGVESRKESNKGKILNVITKIIRSACNTRSPVLQLGRTRIGGSRTGPESHHAWFYTMAYGVTMRLESPTLLVTEVMVL